MAHRAIQQRLHRMRAGLSSRRFATYHKWRNRGLDPASLSACACAFYPGLDVTTSGSAVTSWGDQSGKGNDAVQATADRQPTYNATGGPSNLPAIVFDGSSGTTAEHDLLSTATFSGITTPIGYPFTYFLVFQVTTYKQFGVLMGNGTAAANDHGVHSDNTKTYLFNGTPAPNLGVTDTNWHLLWVEWDGASTRLAIENGTIVTGNPGTTDTTITSISLGNRPAGDQGLVGRIAAAVVLDDATTDAGGNLSLQEIQLIRHHLNRRCADHFTLADLA